MTRSNPAVEPADPPARLTTAGEVRRVGVELEFAGLGVEAAAEAVQTVFGGRLNRKSAHQIDVVTEEFGSFGVELDTKYAHPNTDLEKTLGEDATLVNFDRTVSKAVGDFSEGVVPTEIVTPPLPYPQIARLTSLLEVLRTRNAEGTAASPFYGFGLHLNPEVAADDSISIANTLKAYLIWSPYLREKIDVDATRRLMPYIDPFPARYAAKVLDPAYHPDTGTLIADYLADNPTRNRELDLLPLFKHLRPERIESALDDDRIKARPAYHYRLPDMNLDDPDWSVVREWNRWVDVERLAANSKALNEAAALTLPPKDGGARSTVSSMVLLGLTS